MKRDIKDKESLTRGPIVKSLVILAVPIILANILQTVYELTDTFWVGRLGAEAVASVAVSFPILFFIISLGIGLSMAGAILVSQYRGKRDDDSTNYVASQTIVTVVFVSIVLAIAGWIFAPTLVKFMGTEAAIYKNATNYLRISLVGIIFLFAYVAFQALMRGIGQVKIPAYVVLGTVILNFFLDPLFIFGKWFIPAWGVSGAAVASIGSQSLAALVGMIILFRGKKGIKIRLKEFKPNFKLIQKMVKLGIPASVEQATLALGILIITFLVASFGTTALAAYGIGARILSFMVIPALGLSMATSTLIGHNLGAGKVKRAEKITRKSSVVGFISLTVLGVLFFIFSRALASFFIPGDEAVIAESAFFIKIAALSIGFFAVYQIISGTFRGSGNTFNSMILSNVSVWVVQFPLAYVLSRHTPLGATGIWISFPVTFFVTALITVLWYLEGSWKKRKLTEELKLEKRISEETIIEDGR